MEILIRNVTPEELNTLDKEKFDRLEEKLSEKGITKKKWLNDKVDEEIGD